MTIASLEGIERRQGAVRETETNAIHTQWNKEVSEQIWEMSDSCWVDQLAQSCRLQSCLLPLSWILLYPEVAFFQLVNVLCGGFFLSNKNTKCFRILRCKVCSHGLKKKKKKSFTHQCFIINHVVLRSSLNDLNLTSDRTKHNRFYHFFIYLGSTKLKCWNSMRKN